MSAPNKQTGTEYFIELAVSAIVLMIFLRPPPALFELGFGSHGFGVMKDFSSEGLVPPTIHEQIASGHAITWTQMEYILKDFPDLRDWATPGEYQVLLDPSVSGKAKSAIVYTVGRRKLGLPNDDPYTHPQTDLVEVLP